jgi:hypothetical protein
MDSNIFTFKGLLTHVRHGFRSGGWSRLTRVERGFIRCVLCYTKIRGRLANLRLMVKVAEIVLKLMETPAKRIFKAGEARARGLKLNLEKRGVFQYAPRVKAWLNTVEFKFYLGVMTLQGG